MRMPEKPPVVDSDLLDTEAFNRLYAAFNEVREPTYKGKYVHWDKLRRLVPPEGLTHQEWWSALKFRRTSIERSVPLRDSSGSPFVYGLPDPIPEQLHQIDQNAGGHLGSPDLIANPETRNRYVISSLVEEAITSSQLEGAVTTRQIAKEMIRSKRPPVDESECMILNNYRTMQRIRELRHEDLSKDLVFELHRILTHDTLEDYSAGAFRRDDDRIRVQDQYNEVFHVPPAANELEDRMQAMCAFANGQSPGTFVHPVLRSIILHFWLAYDHPFVDGNGRCARALFYWSMLRHGYWLCEYLSISQVIRRAPVQYYRAFLHTETDSNDLTYFVLYHLRLIEKAVQSLHEYLNLKREQLRSAESLLRSSVELNHRQRALISHALRHPGHRYSIESHRSSHGIVYETARTDLLDLAERGFLESRKIGRTWYFEVAQNLEAKLRAAK